MIKRDYFHLIYLNNENVNYFECVRETEREEQRESEAETDCYRERERERERCNTLSVLTHYLSVSVKSMYSENILK